MENPEEKLDPAAVREMLEHKMQEEGVRPSPVRLLVLGALAESEVPMSTQDIETALDTVDRSSVTRALGLFQKRGLVHAIADGTETVKYEICRGHHTQSHSDEHVHFHCTSCGRTVCLSDTPVPAVELPEGYEARHSNYVITGVCPACWNRNF